MVFIRLTLALFALLTLSATASLRADDERPVVNDSGIAPEKPAVRTLPTLWIAGDSTVRNNAPARGWGQDLGRFFDPKKINIVNRAIGGRSSRTFFAEGRWQAIIDAIKPGDWVVIQFGHNDGGPTGATNKFRGSLHGMGEETEDVTKPDGSVETVHTFGWYLHTYARTARAKGAKVILCSPIPHKRFDSFGRFIRDWAEWRGWIAACAKDENVFFVDLSELIASRYEQLTRPEIEALFADKGTHTNAAGSLLNARALVSGLQQLPGNPLGPCFSAEATR